MTTSKTREAFEAWASRAGLTVAMDDGEYLGTKTAGAWLGYQAGRAVALEEAAQVCDEYVVDCEVDAEVEENADYADRWRVYAKHVRRCAKAIRALAAKTQEE